MRPTARTTHGHVTLGPVPAAQPKLEPRPSDAEPLHSVEALREMADLLALVQFWRMEAERLAHDYAWIAQQNTRRHEAKKVAK